jgi:hypothetical protein
VIRPNHGNDKRVVLGIRHRDRSPRRRRRIPPASPGEGATPAHTAG